MSIQEPAWLKRSRPCPFFSQGRCLFADACNFLHDVKVRSAVSQPTVHVKQLHYPLNQVFNPPSVVVDTVGPRSVNPASPQSPPSPTHDSSRYSGLLSVLSDVIGPPSLPPATAEASVPPSRLMSSMPGPQGTEHDRTNLPSGFDSTDTVAKVSDQGPSSHPEPSSIPQPDSEAALVDPFRYQMESFVPEADGNEFYPVSGDEGSSHGDTTSYLVEGTYVIGSEDEEDDDHEEDDPTMVLSNRQSVLSSFTGASLLASPRHSAFGSPPVAGTIGDGTVPLLSPVQMSAKLRPFPGLSLDPKVKRGDSIDSGYADGDNWVSPPPFPRSPPRSFRSPVVSPPYSRRGSLSSPTRKERRTPCDVGALRPLPLNLIEIIKEVESEGNLGDNEDAAHTIFDAYDVLPSERHSKHGTCDSVQVHVAGEMAEEDRIIVAGCSPPRHSTEHPRLTREYDLHSCNQHSFIPDDNLSFKTALSTQPSCDDLSDISRVSLVKQDSLLSYLSGRSTPNTSVLSHYDANEALDQSIDGSSAYESLCLDSSTALLDAGASEERLLTEDIAMDSKVLSEFVSACAGDTQGSALQTVTSPLGCPSTDSTSHDPSAANDHAPRSVDDPRKVIPEKALTLQDQSPGYFHLDEQPAESSPLVGPFRGGTVSGVQEFAPPKCLPVDFVERSSTWRPSAESSCNSSLLENIPEHALPGSDGKGFRAPVLFPTVSHDLLSEYDVPLASQSMVAENSLGFDKATEVFDSVCDSSFQRLSFPLPPAFLPAEIVGSSSIHDEDASALFGEAAASPEADASNACTASQYGETELHSGSELTEKARPSQLPPAASPDSSADLTLRRGRAVSELTVKAGDLSDTLTSVEQSGPANSVQSLYDQYFGDGDGSESSSFVHDDASHPDAKEFSQAGDPQFPGRGPLSDKEPGSSGAPRSGTILRPPLTGWRSLLHSSLSELIPEANDNEAPPTSPPARLEVREAGSTMVPLGFRRYKPRPSKTQSLQPLHTVLPAHQLREILRIRTDIAREDSPLGCSSATHPSFTTQSPLPVKAMSAPPTGGLRQLRLSSIISKRSSILSTQSSSIASSILSLDQLFNSSTPQSPSVSSTTSFSHNSSLSPSCVQIPEHIHHTFQPSSSNSPILQGHNDVSFASQSSNRRDSRSVSAPTQQPRSWRLSHYRAGSRNYIPADGTRRISRRTSTLSLPYAVDEEHEINDDFATSHPIQLEPTDDRTHPTSALAPPVHAIATPKPNLLFAIASDDVDQVRQVLESGEAGPNDCIGPQSALAFTLTNDKLAHKQEIVKALLAYGANPATLRNPMLNPAPRTEGNNEPNGPPPETTLEGMDPATRYFISRADATHTRQTSQLIYRSFFRPLTRVRYDVIGQDWALEQLFRVLSMHSQKLAVAPIVVLLCGPSGHGKSLLARKFGSLLDVPTHTVNMTTLRSTHDIWQSHSMSPYEDPSTCTLAEFLTENEGKRCVVVLDEIEKVEDQKALWSLLMPWELGRCSLTAGKRHVDARNVIWLGTSNIGHELVFEHHDNRAESDRRMSREDYLELTALLRPRVSHCLGASLVSRVTTVLPFVPFTMDEKKAIAAEAVHALAGHASLSPRDVESLVSKALPSYHPSEGARSLHRAISNILVDAI